MGCTLVEDRYAAHYRGAVDHESLRTHRDSARAILIPAKNRCKPRLDNPSVRNLNFESTHQRKYVQHRFVLDLSFTEVNLPAAHDCRQVAAPKARRRASAVERSKDYRGSNVVAGIRVLLGPHG